MKKIIFIGDIYGKLGRETIKKLLPKIKREHKPDLIIANAENVAHGSGITIATMEELFASGIDCLTMGDHTFDRSAEAKACLSSSQPIIRPANFPTDAPGNGLIILEKAGQHYAIINLLGRVNMPFQYDCPFKKSEELLKEIKLANIKIAAIIVDMHAETTAEKICFGHFLDGQVSAIVGTHTHIPTADARVLPKGSAYITDAGMTGALDESLGLGLEGATKSLISQYKHQRTVPDKGRIQLNCVLLEIDESKAKTKSIKQLTYLSEIK
jgi:metallophosphoesterase (TIGR00282 family)